jgi:hypothetical protein
MDRITLKASEGMLLTDGEIYAKVLVLGDWDKAENYREITEEEYNALMAVEEGGEDHV